MDVHEITSIEDLPGIGWTDEDTKLFLYVIERGMSIAVSPEWIGIFLRDGLENNFTRAVLIYFVNRYWIYRHTIDLETVQDAIGYAIAKSFSIQ